MFFLGTICIQNVHSSTPSTKEEEEEEEEERYLRLETRDGVSNHCNCFPRAQSAQSAHICPGVGLSLRVSLSLSVSLSGGPGRFGV